MTLFARLLVEARRKAGLSQYALAEKLGVSRGYVAQLEQGGRGPPPVQRWPDLLRVLPSLDPVALIEAGAAEMRDRRVR